MVITFDLSPGFTAFGGFYCRIALSIGSVHDIRRAFPIGSSGRKAQVLSLCHIFACHAIISIERSLYVFSNGQISIASRFGDKLRRIICSRLELGIRVIANRIVCAGNLVRTVSVIGARSAKLVLSVMDCCQHLPRNSIRIGSLLIKRLVLIQRGFLAGCQDVMPTVILPTEGVIAIPQKAPPSHFIDFFSLRDPHCPLKILHSRLSTRAEIAVNAERCIHRTSSSICTEF